MGLDERPNPQTPAPSGSGTAMRMNAIGALKEMIARKQKEVDNLDELRRWLSSHGPLDQLADEALWKLIVAWRGP